MKRCPCCKGCKPSTQSLLGAALLALLLVPALRQWLEASMWRHMVLQFPLLMVAGAALAGGLGPRARATLARYNHLGIAGLVFVAVVLSVFMVPRLLDVVLRDMGAEAIKHAALLAAGALLRLSWAPAGLIVQGFFLGNVLPMMAVVGQLYADSPLRLCNAYLQDDQARLGQWLTASALLLALTWLAQTAWLLRDKPIPPENPPPGQGA